MSLRLPARRPAAAIAGVAGCVNLLSALYPAIPSRMEILRDLLPMHLIRASQTITVLIGFCLILLADGLRMRRRRAFQLTVVLLGLSAVLHLAKGLDFEECIIDAVAAAFLFANRDAFHIRGRSPLPQHVVQRITAFCLAYYCYVLAGFLVLRRAITPAPTIAAASTEPFRLLLDAPQFHYLTPHAQWFARSLVLFAGVASLYALARLIRPLLPVPASTQEEVHEARRLIRRYGSDTLAYFALQDGRSYFFDSTGEAFLSYRLQGTVALVAGDPIGRADRIEPLVRDFLDFAESGGMEPCFLGIDRRYEEVYRRMGIRLLKIGEEAIINLDDFDSATLKRKVRRAARHVADLGITAQRYRASEVPKEVYAQLQVISRRWLEAKGGAQGFSMTLGRLPRPEDDDCEYLVATDGDRVVGYLSLVPARGGQAWSLDAMRRREDSPNGLTEFLVIQATEIYRAEGVSAISLNFATLSNAQDDIASRTIESTRQFLWEQLSSVYQLKSLYQFNTKFGPSWHSRYLGYRAPHKIPKLAVAIAQAEAPLQNAIPLLRRDT